MWRKSARGNCRSEIKKRGGNVRGKAARGFEFWRYFALLCDDENIFAIKVNIDFHNLSDYHYTIFFLASQF